MRDYDVLRALIERLGVHPALGSNGEGWGIEQNPHELATFLAALPTDLRTVLEIGTGHKAGLTRFMSECLGWDVTTVDRNPPDAFAPIARQIIGLSQDVVEQARGEYDLVIIDADHSYEAAKRDFELYGSMGRIVMFHDIGGLRDCEGARQLWAEIKESQIDGFSASRHEVIAENGQRAGIGWLMRRV